MPLIVTRGRVLSWPAGCVDPHYGTGTLYCHYRIVCIVFLHMLIIAYL